MAQLQLAVCSRVDPIVSNPNLPASSQEKCHSEAFREQPRLEHLRTNIQQQLLSNKDKKLKDVCIKKGRSASCSEPAESNQLISENAGFWSAGPHNWYLKKQASTLSSLWRPKRRGVDRAYPLKPVFHQKAENGSIPSSWQVANPQATETPSPSISSEKKGRAHAAKAQHIGVPFPFSVEQSKRATSHPRRAESGYIQKLEAAGRNLEQEIQRKEALLREKLRRTEEELRRIQWEKQQAEAKARKEQGLWMPERKAADISWRHLSRPTAQPNDGLGKTAPNIRVASTETIPVPSELHMERLKKQRLMASNSKIRENVSQENATLCAEVASRHDQSPTAVPLGQTDCMVGAPPLPYTEAPNSVEDWGECNFCGRKLYCSRLEKHMSICSKNHGSKRKVFDSSKARAKGTELETYNLLMGSQKKTSTKSTDGSKQGSMQSKQSNWRQKHESFINTLRRAREVQRVISKGGKTSDLLPAPPMENPDYKLCPYCTRQFAPKVAERHIPKCKNIKNRPPPPPQQKRRC
ncbi:zinc finger C2HC domain-containing protein 1C [Heteronotia binoei]|uniref:zinc finger C2HC domain-containing protein 1C n=1 Tax=Heteronotia binoei TaxID=13085 RepID=UPI002930D885|nr:zinc finger C2HC domain-containing protein 1C [Heteronotia binoei]XP_060117246.1 zinc finger C2HC domain-containing protein 1C [Heteronotia binoei]